MIYTFAIMVVFVGVIITRRIVEGFRKHRLIATRTGRAELLARNLRRNKIDTVIIIWQVKQYLHGQGASPTLIRAIMRSFERKGIIG